MNERELFIAALQIEDPVERAAYLDQACGGDIELRRRLDVLLAAHNQPASVLEHPLAGNIGERQRESSPIKRPLVPSCRPTATTRPLASGRKPRRRLRSSAA